MTYALIQKVKDRCWFAWDEACCESAYFTHVVFNQWGFAERRVDGAWEAF
jgi:hypothetical protein